MNNQATPSGYRQVYGADIAPGESRTVITRLIYLGEQFNRAGEEFIPPY